MGIPALSTEKIDISQTRPALIAAELDALFQVSQVFSQSLDLKQTSKGVLLQLHEFAGIRNGMVALVQPDSSELMVLAAHGDEKSMEVRYRSGER